MLASLTFAMSEAARAATVFSQHWLFWACAVFGTVVGAFAGATASSRVQMDVFGVLTLGCVAALGGGTLRDILLGGLHTESGGPVAVYWVMGEDVQYLYYALGTSFVVMVYTRFHKLPIGTIRVMDAFAMAFFTLLGASKAQMLGCNWVVSILMGMFTGVAGGALRDVLTGNVPYVFRPGELYATASLVGCLLYVVLQWVGVPYDVSFILSVAAAFITRMAAVYLNWQLPSYRPLFENKEGGADAEEKGPRGQ